MACCLCAPPAGNAVNGEVSVPIGQGAQDQQANGEVPVPIQQQGAQDQEANGDVPETRMNRAALMEVFFASAASSIGTVGFVWATVVLLGGFEMELNQVDFWFITVVSFFQAIRIFGGDWNADQKIIYGLPLGILSPEARTCSFLTCCLDYCSIYTPKLSCLLLSGKLVCIFAAFLVRLLKFVVLLGTLLLSVIRLVLGNMGPSAGGTNLKSAFSLFYGLAIVQAVVSYMAFSYSHALEDLVQDIRGRYKFPDTADNKPFELYYAHVKKMCKAGRITETMSMTLLAFAVESLSSNEQKARFAGVKILHYLMQTQDYRERTLSSVRDSIDAAESLFKMIASTSQDEGPMEARKVATSFMATVAGNLPISGIPCATQSICSLLEETRGDQPNGLQGVPGNNGHRNPDKSLKGMEILEQLSLKNCNLAEISSSDELMSKITEFTAMNSDKAKYSLSVLSRLAGAIGEQGTMIRQVILRNVFLLSNIREILQARPNNDQRLQELQMLAIQIVDGFALDSEARNHGALPKILTELLNIFCEEPNGELRLATGKALARLTVESRVNCNTILKAYNFEGLRGMLFNDQAVAHRVNVGNIMKNLCAYCEVEPSNQDQYETFMGFVGDNMATVLRTIINQTQNLVGEDMEAFLGLALQCSKLIPPEDFLEALNGTASDVAFEQKLKSVLDQANNAEPGGRRPGIRRFAIEQAIWMMRSDSEERLHRTDSFVNCGMRDALTRVQQTATRAENYKLLSGSIPVLEYEESLPTLAERALRLIDRPRPGWTVSA